MLVKDRMTTPVITATPEEETAAALRRMYSHKIRRLPVVDAHGKLLGIVTQRDLLDTPQGTTPIGDVMTASPYTTAPEVSIIHAAAVLRTLGIGALPVLDHGRLAGIITESDIFDAFLELLGARHEGVRLIVPLAEVGRDLPRLLQTLAAGRGRLTGVTTLTSGGRPSVMLTTDEQDPRDIVRALVRGGFEPAHISVEHKAA